MINGYLILNDTVNRWRLLPSFFQSLGLQIFWYLLGVRNDDARSDKWSSNHSESDGGESGEGIILREI
jgi:hypothetical protein